MRRITPTSELESSPERASHRSDIELAMEMEGDWKEERYRPKVKNVLICPFLCSFDIYEKRGLPVKPTVKGQAVSCLREIPL